MKRKNGIIFVVGGLIVLLLFVALNPLAFVPGNGGGGEYIPPPPPDPPIPPPPELVPNVPTLQSIPSPDNDGSIYLKWDMVTGALGYQVFMSKDGGSWQSIKTTGSIAFIKSGLTNGVYCFRVRAYNNIGNSPYSNIRSVTVSLPLPPDAPVLYSIIPNPNTDGEISLEWGLVSNAIDYEVFRSKDGGSFELLETIGENENYYNDLVLCNGNYLYKVRAGNDVGYSEFSNTESIIVTIFDDDNGEPPVVPLLDNIPSPNTDGLIELSWSDSGVVNGFEIFRSVNGGAFEFFKDLGSTTYLFSESDGDYSYKVRAYNNDGYSDYSNIVSVTVDIPGVEPPAEPFEISPIYYLIIISATILVSAILLSKVLKKQLKQLKSNQK